MTTEIKSRSIPRRILAFILTLCMIVGFAPNILPAASAAPTEIGVGSHTLVAPNALQITVNGGSASPTYRMTHWGGSAWSNPLQWSSSNTHRSVTAEAAPSGVGSDPADPAYWKTPQLSLNAPNNGRITSGTITDVIGGTVAGGSLFAQTPHKMEQDDLIDNTTGLNGSDGAIDTLIIYGWAPGLVGKVELVLTVSLRYSSVTNKVDSCRFTIAATNKEDPSLSTSKAYVYGMSWNVDTMVGYGSAGSGGDAAKFQGQSINKFSTSEIPVKFPTPNSLPWVGGTVELFPGHNNTYSSDVPNYIYGVHPSDDTIVAVFYPQINGDRAYQGGRFERADFVAMDFYSNLYGTYYFDLTSTAAAGSQDSGHIVRYNPRLLLPGQTLLFGIDYGMGVVGQSSDNAPWIAANMPELTLNKNGLGTGYDDHITMDLTYGNGINSVAYENVILRMYTDPTYLTLDSSMTIGANSWTKNVTLSTATQEVWELVVATSASKLTPGLNTSAVPAVKLVGTPVYVDTAPGAWDGAETPIKIDMVISDASYSNGITADMTWSGTAQLERCEALTLNGRVWRDVNGNNVRESFEGVSGSSVVLRDSGNNIVDAVISVAQGVVAGPSGIVASQLQYVTLELPANDFTYAVKGIKVWINDQPIASGITSADNHPIFERLTFTGYDPNGNRTLAYEIKAGQAARIDYEIELALGAVVDIFAFEQGTDKTDSSITQPGGTIDINASGTPFAINRLHTQRAVAGDGITVTYFTPMGYRIAGTYALQAVQTLANLGSFAEGHRYPMDFELVNKDVRLTGISNATATAIATQTNTAQSSVTLLSMDWHGQIGQLDIVPTGVSTNRADYTWTIVSDPQNIITNMSNTGNATFHGSNLGVAVIRVALTAEPNLFHEMQITLQTGTSATIDSIYIARVTDLSTPITSMALTKSATEDLVLVGVDNGTGALTKLPNSTSFISGDPSILTITPSSSDHFVFNMYGVNGGYTNITANYQALSATANVLVTNQPLAGASIKITPNPITLSSSQTETVTYELLFANGMTQVIPATVVSASVVNTGVAILISTDRLRHVSDGSTTLNAVLTIDTSVRGSAVVNASSGGAPVTGSGTLRLQESSTTGGFIAVGGPAEYFAYLDADNDGQFGAGDTVLPYSSVNVNYLSQYGKFSIAAGSGDNVRITGTTTGMDQLIVEYTDGGTTYRASANVVIHSTGYTYNALRVVPSPLVLEVGETRNLNVYAEFINGGGATEQHLLHHSMYTGSITGTAAALAAGTQNQVVGMIATNECTYTATLNTDTSKTGMAKILVIPAGAYLEVTPPILWIEKGTTGTVSYALRSQGGGNTIPFANLTDYISASIYNTSVANFAGGTITTLNGAAVGRTVMEAYLSGQPSSESITIYVWDDTFNGTSGVEWVPSSLSITAGYTDNASLWLLDDNGTRVTTVDMADLIASGTLTSADTSTATIPSNPSGPSLVVTGESVTVTSNTTIDAACPAGNASLPVTVISSAVVYGLAANPQIIELWPTQTKAVTITDTGLGVPLNAAQLGALTNAYTLPGQNDYSVVGSTIVIEQDTGVPAGGSVNVLTLTDASNNTAVIYIINHTQNPYQANYTRELTIDPELTSVEIGGTATDTAARLTVTDATNTVIDNIILPPAVVTWQANTTTSLSGRVNLAASTVAAETVEITGTQAGAQTYRVNYSAGTTPLSATGRVFVYAQPTANIQSFELLPASITLSIGDMDGIVGKITYNNGNVQNITAQELPYAVPDLASVNTAIATASATGLVEGKTVGTTSVDGTLINTTQMDSVPVSVLSGWSISGTVIDAVTNLPIVGADIYLDGGVTVVATTAAGGVYTIAGVANGLHTVSADAAGYTPNQANVNVSGGNANNVTIPLSPIPAATYAVSGQVTDVVTTMPIAGATVIAGGQTTTTDSNGDYALTLADGTYTVTASMSGYIANTANVAVNGAAETGVDIALTPFAGTTYIVTGKVTNASNGSNIVGAQIQVGGSTLAITDNNGNYSIALPDGTYTITASAGASYTVETSPSFTVNGGNVIGINLALAPIAASTYTVSGQVTDAGTGNPIAGASVNLGGGLTATTNATGDYSISGVADSSYTATVTATGYVSGTGSVTVNGANVPSLDFALNAVVPNTYNVEGIISDATTLLPIAGATVTIQGTALTATTTATGTYIITNVPSGNYIVEATATGYAPNTTTVTVSTANVTQVDILLAPLGGAVFSVSGQVTDAATNAPIVGATVTIAGQTGVTNSNGDYTVNNVPDAATFNAVASALTYTSGSISVTMAGGNVTNADIQLGLTPVSIYTITGRVLINGTTTPIVGAAVTGNGQTVLTNALGDYIISGVASGTYTVSVGASGYNSASASVIVAAANAVQSFNLTASGGGGGGGTSGGSGYTVRYEANGGTGNRTVSGITSGSKHAVLDVDATTIKFAGQIFQGWNTQRDGKGTSYAPGEEITITASLTLYAQWREEVALDKDNHFAYLFGDDNGSFRPLANMTRAETAQMLYNLLLDKSHNQTVSFSDLPSGEWYTEAVKTLASKGVIKGYPDGTFRPNAPITRSEFVTMLSRFTSISSGEMIFTDIPSNHWAYQYIVSATSKGWINGYPDGTFRPEQNITRAEATKVTNALLNRSADEGYVDAHPSINRFPDVASSWAFYEIMEATVSHDFNRTQTSGEIWTEVKK